MPAVLDSGGGIGWRDIIDERQPSRSRRSFLQAVKIMPDDIGLLFSVKVSELHAMLTGSHQPFFTAVLVCAASLLELDFKCLE